MMMTSSAPPTPCDDTAQASHAQQNSDSLMNRGEPNATPLMECDHNSKNQIIEVEPQDNDSLPTISTPDYILISESEDDNEDDILDFVNPYSKREKEEQECAEKLYEEILEQVVTTPYKDLRCRAKEFCRMKYTEERDVVQKRLEKYDEVYEIQFQKEFNQNAPEGQENSDVQKLNKKLTELHFPYTYGIFEGVGNCMRGGILKGFYKLDTAEDLDKVIYQGKISESKCDHEYTVTMRDLLCQSDNPTEECDGSSVTCNNLTARGKGVSKGCRRGVYVSGMCKGKLRFSTSGLMHNHCSVCPRFGKCLDEFTLLHCPECGHHYYTGKHRSCSCQFCCRGKLWKTAGCVNSLTRFAMKIVNVSDGPEGQLSSCSEDETAGECVGFNPIVQLMVNLQPAM